MAVWLWPYHELARGLNQALVGGVLRVGHEVRVVAHLTGTTHSTTDQGGGEKATRVDHTRGTSGKLARYLAELEQEVEELAPVSLAHGRLVRRQHALLPHHEQEEHGV